MGFFIATEQYGSSILDVQDILARKKVWLRFPRLGHHQNFGTLAVKLHTYSAFRHQSLERPLEIEKKIVVFNPFYFKT